MYLVNVMEPLEFGFEKPEGEKKKIFQNKSMKVVVRK